MERDERSNLRVEALLQDIRGEQRRDAAEWERRFDLLQSNYSTINNEVILLRRRQDEQQTLIVGARETALGAMRKSEASIHEMDSVAAGIVSHLARIEGTREESDKKQDAAIGEIQASLAKSEAQRSAASAAHAERFKRMGEAINAILEGQGGDRKLRILQFVLLPAAVVIFLQLIELGKVFVAAKYHVTPSQVEVRP